VVENGKKEGGVGKKIRMTLQEGAGAREQKLEKQKIQ